MSTEVNVNGSEDIKGESEFRESCEYMAIELACELYKKIDVCDLECGLVNLINPEIDAEYAAVGQDGKRTLERLNQLLRIKRRLIGFIEAGHSFIEDVEALTGADIEKTTLTNLANRLARRHQARASEQVEPTEQVEQMSFKNYSNTGTQIPRPAWASQPGESK